MLGKKNPQEKQKVDPNDKAKSKFMDDEKEMLHESLIDDDMEGQKKNVGDT
jgi:hypothetical protein